MKILVTGGLGYIGSITTAHLIEAGHEVVILDNLSSGNLDTLPENVKLIKGDIVNISSLIKASDKFEAVFHFAGLIVVGDSIKVPEAYWAVNVVGSFELLRTMKRLNIKKLIFSSTAAVYGNPIKLPIMENDQTTPTNPYGMTKLAVDMMIANECLAYGLAATSLRYFNVAGAYKNLGERHPNESHIIPLVFDTLSGKRDIFTLFGNDYNTKDGTCIRDYIHVADLAEAHLLALDHLKSGQHNIYNLGNGNGFSNLEVIYTTEKVTGKKISLVVRPRREGDPEVLIASSQLAKNKLGWAPKRIKLETIIEDAWNFYKK